MTNTVPNIYKHVDMQEKNIKPGYDSRQEYTKNLSNIISSIHLAWFDKRYDDMLELLQIGINFVSPFLSTTNIEKLDGHVKQCKIPYSNESLLSNKKSNVYESVLKRKLLIVHREFMISARDLLLPTSESGITEFDEDEFLRGSDL